MYGNNVIRAIINPNAVVKSAAAIPPATSVGSVNTDSAPSNLKESIIPSTVPKIPRSGAAVIIVESATINRSILGRCVSTAPIATASLVPFSTIALAISP